MDLEAARQTAGGGTGLFRTLTMICFALACLLMIASLIGPGALTWSFVDGQIEAGQTVKAPRRV